MTGQFKTQCPKATALFKHISDQFNTSMERTKI